ncbi:copper resistance protein B [Salinisphaera orenii]|uniref:copper resistance protein B n=1 Tax=Salinisphaera orenii TaxID=856731 RepID=UPI000DBE97D2
MFENAIRQTRRAVCLLLITIGAAQAAPDGKADLDAVIPSGEKSSASGAPAAWQQPVNDDKPYSMVLVDRLEYGATDGPDNYLWDAQGWIGGDYNKFWLSTEGEGLTRGGSPESAQFEAKYARAIAPYFTAQGGLRYDTHPGDDRVFGVANVTGLAPYWFETDNSLYVSEDGVVSFAGEYEYELLLTQRVLLQPRLEFSVAASNASDYGLGSGLRSTEMGLRLRYEIRREFAPYVGVRWERKYGETRDMARDAGESGSSTAFVVGLRMWW